MSVEGDNGQRPDITADDVGRALGRRVTSYDVEVIDPHLRIHSVTGGVYRVRAEDMTLVVKVVRHGAGATPDGLWGADDDESARNYWKREWLAFDSGLLDALPGRLRAPRRLLTTEPSANECWVWMEDVRGRTGSALQPDDFDAVAFALGTTQGSYAAGTTPLPTQAWLSREWLRGWVGVCRDSFIDAVVDDEGWQDERLAPMAVLRPRVAALWSAYDELLAVAESAPPTLTHWDFWPANVSVSGTRTDSDVVAIDWSQVGISGLTHDLDQLTLDTVWMYVHRDAVLDELERRVLSAYVAGLHAAGAQVSPAEVRRWYAATAAARYAWLIGGYPRLAADAEAQRSLELRFGDDFASVVATRARVVQRAVELGEWALSALESQP